MNSPPAKIPQTFDAMLKHGTMISAARYFGARTNSMGSNVMTRRASISSVTLSCCQSRQQTQILSDHSPRWRSTRGLVPSSHHARRLKREIAYVFIGERTTDENVCQSPGVLRLRAAGQRKTVQS